MNLLNILTGGLVGALLTYLFGVWREKRERKRKFQAAVQLILLEIEAAPREEIGNVHKNSIVPLREQAAHVLLDVPLDRHEAFRENLKKYSQRVVPRLPIMAADPLTKRNVLNPAYEEMVASICGLLENLRDLAG